MKRQITAVTFSLAACMLGASVKADVVSYTRIPLSNVIAHLNQKYGIHIVMKGNLANKPTLPITFSVGVPSETTTRLMVIAALANAANVNFQKGYVVSKAAADQTPPDVPIDTNGWVVFKDKTVSVQEAINTVASTDDATVQISPDVTGTVTFSATKLRDSQAAQEIAKQTHTVWRTYYALTPENIMAVTPHPFTSFSSPAPPPPANPTPDNTTASTPAVPGTNPTQVAGAPPYQYVPPVGAPGYGTPYGGYGYAAPYGGYGAPYGGYGYGSPYGGYMPYGGYGYGNPFAGFGYGMPYYPTGGQPGYLNILPGGGGYGPFGGYGGPPVTFR